MSGRSLVFCLLLLFTACLCDHHGTPIACPANPLCSGETVNITCALPLHNYSVSWQILDSSGSEVETVWVNDTTGLGSGLNGGFSVIRVGDNSIATLTAAANMDNYWFVCNTEYEYGNVSDSDSQNCTINVNTPQMPQNVSLFFGSLTNTSIIVNWTAAADDDCTIGYRVSVLANNVNVTSANLDAGMEYYTINTIQNRSSDTEYCLRIIPRGMDRLYRNLAVITPRCITFDTPLAVSNIQANPVIPITLSTPDMTPVNVTLTWTVTQSSRPRIRYYYITHNATRHLESPPSSGSGSGSGMTDGMISPSQFITQTYPRMMMRGQPVMRRFRLIGAQVGETYSVTIVAVNALGNGTAASTVFTLAATTPPPPTTSTPSIQTPTSSTSQTPTPSVVAEDSPALATWAIAVIAVAAGVILAIVAAVVIIFICCCCCVAASARKNEEHEMTEGTKL